MPTKCILLLLDGLGDRSYDSLGGLTPLQAADTRNLDRIASAGSNGLFHADPWVALPSENAHFAMFGFEKDEFPGRGCLEALGAGIDLAPGDVAVLAHFVSAKTKKGVLILEKDRPESQPEEIPHLIETVQEAQFDGVSFKFVHTGNLDGILLISGDVSRFVTDSDPIREGDALISPEPWKSHLDDKAAGKTAQALKKYILSCHEKLEKLPLNEKRQIEGRPLLNMVTTNRAGSLNPVATFSNRWGLKGLSISSGIVYHGLCKLLCMDIVKVKDSREPGDDLAERLGKALSVSDKYDFIHVHTKAPDAASHEKNPMLKKKIIEKLDEGLGKVADKILENPEILLIVTSDHSTPCTRPLIHSAEPVPIIVAGEGVRKDVVDKFDEVNCTRGALGFIKGNQFMKLVLNGLDRCKLDGLMDTPVDQPYWPGRTKPLRFGEV